MKAIPGPPGWFGGSKLYPGMFLCSHKQKLVQHVSPCCAISFHFLPFPSILAQEKDIWFTHGGRDWSHFDAN